MSSEFSRCNDEVSELAWENGQLAMHGLQLKHQAWNEPLPDILDSIFMHQEFQNIYDLPPPSSAGSDHIIETSSSIGHEKMDVRLKEKVQSILEVENWKANVVQPDQEFESMERENKMARSESGNYFCGRQNSKMKENLDGDNKSKGESIGSPSSSRRHSRASASGIHNQSERRRRERINQKMRALQKLVPNASKTDKASMLDEVIDYLKDLQAQVQIMTNARRMHEMAIPLRIQQQQQQQQQQKQLQTLLLARMGARMLDFNSFAQHVPPSFLPPSFLPPFHNLGVSSTSYLAPPFICMPEAAPPPDPARANIDVSSIHSPVSDFSKVYNTLLAQQSANTDLLSKMVGMYQQQEANPSSSKTVSNDSNAAFTK